MFGADESQARPGGRGMLDILTEEHRRLEDLYARLARAVGDEAELASLTSVLTATIIRHLSAEEQYLCPTIRSVLPDGDRLADVEVEAGQTMRYALRRLESGPPSDLNGIEEVEPALRLHIGRCRDSLFPQLRAALDPTELIRLGNRIEIATEAAPTRPHPTTPATPPWNKVVEPAVGVVDKVLDVVSGRSTRAEDV
jgi:hypothetical protein